MTSTAWSLASPISALRSCRKRQWWAKQWRKPRPSRKSSAEGRSRPKRWRKPKLHLASRAFSQDENGMRGDRHPLDRRGMRAGEGDASSREVSRVPEARGHGAYAATNGSRRHHAGVFDGNPGRKTL